MSTTESARVGGRWLLLGAATMIVLAGLKAAQSLVIPFLLAVFLAVICAPVVAFLTRRRVPVWAAVLLVVVVLLATFSGLGAVVGGSVNEFTAFASQQQARFDALVDSASEWLAAHHVDPQSLDALNVLQPGKVINMLGGVLRSFAAVLSNLLLILLTTIFILLEAASFPTKMRAASRTGDVRVDHLAQIVIQVQHYLGIKTATSLTTGLLIGVWTAAIGLEFAVVLGLLAFLLNYIPSIGSIVAAVPAVLLGLVQDGVGYALVVVLGYLVVNLVIGNFVEPVLMGRTLGLSTLVVFLSLVFWGWMWGSIGMLLSVPLTMIVKILLENTDDLQWVAVLLDSRRGVERRLAAASAKTAGDEG